MTARHLKHWPPRMTRHICPPRTSIWSHLETSAARYPDRTAVEFYGAAHNYEWLARQASLIAGFLQRRCGIKRGDRVALYMQNSPQFIAAYYGILRADAMVVPISPMLIGEDVARICNDCDARIAIVAQDLLTHVQPLMTRIFDQVLVACYADCLPETMVDSVPENLRAPRILFDGPGLTSWQAAVDAGCEPTAHLADANDRCLLPYTSGTTGEPKGCIHTHASVAHTTLALAQWNSWATSDCVLATLPLSHVTGMQNSMNTPLYLGCTIVVMARWNRDTAAEFIQRHKVTRWCAVPTMVIDLLSSPEVDRYELGSLVEIGGGGAAMPQAIAQRLQELCGIQYTEGYGLTETMAPSHINPIHRSKQQCLGIPIFDTDSRVVDPETFLECAAGDIGEIITRGPQVFSGYWNKPQATVDSFVDIEGERFFRTGDLARTDEDGYFHFVDRLKRMINSAGLKVWPAEVESLLFAHPDVQEAVVIGSRDARKGEVVKALIVLKSHARHSPDAQAIIEWARSKMAAYKIPRQVEFVESLPKSPTGKVAWRVLQDRENA